MLDHIGFAVIDLPRAKRLYESLLAPLGITLVLEVTAEQTGGRAHAGFGTEGKPFLWLGEGGERAGPLHVAFTAPSRAAVDAFHQAGLTAGGRDNGAPGLRAHYHPHYYGAFVLDPDGNNIEAVCHRPE